MALALRNITNAKFIFDMRGFWADERVDGGLWRPNSPLFRIAKWFEKQFFLAADHVVSLTQVGAEEIRRFDYLLSSPPPLSVIPTCADLSIFQPMRSDRMAPDTERFTLGYVGSAGTWYLFEVFVESFRQLRSLRPNSRALILNRGEHELIRTAFQRAGVPDDAVELFATTHAEVPFQMSRMDATAFFIRPVFSKKASAPTKLAEFLGCGIPCLTNTGVGDMSRILQDARVGVSISNFTDVSIREGVGELLALCDDPSLRSRCRETAERHFSLAGGVAAYNIIYEGFDSSSQSSH